MLPFMREQFFEVFSAYNTAVWPAQVLAYGLGVVVVMALVRPSATGDRVVSGALSALWIWTGVAYHGIFFSSINTAALAFGALFVLQGALFFVAGVSGRRLGFRHASEPVSWVGWALVAYAAVIYPLLGPLTGHAYPAQPTFGITPCPLTLFTFGALLLTHRPVPRWLLVIPLAWSLVGGSATFMVGMPQDGPLLFSGLAIVLLVLRDRQRSDRSARHALQRGSASAGRRIADGVTRPWA